MKEWMSLFLLIVAVSLFGSFGFLFFRPSAAFIGFAHAVGEILWFFIVLGSILYLKTKVVELEEEMNYERRRTEVEIEHLRMLIQHPVAQPQSGGKSHEH